MYVYIIRSCYNSNNKVCFFINSTSDCCVLCVRVLCIISPKFNLNLRDKWLNLQIVLLLLVYQHYTGVLISPQPDQEGNKLQRPNSNFESQKKKKIRWLSVQPGLRGSNDLRVGRKIVTFQLFFFGRVGLRTYQHPCIKFTYMILTKTCKTQHCCYHNICMFIVPYIVAVFDFCVSMHHHMGFIRTSLMQIVQCRFYYTICSTCFGCNTHPSSGAI